jgi:predicted  nucleic acid-binding Zn-ribbon protein
MAQDEMKQLKEMDSMLFEEISEISEFETQLFSLEYELDDEEKLIAKLHNTCRATLQTIKHLHYLIRKINTSNEDKSIPIFKNMIKRQIEKIEADIEEIMSKIEKLAIDEAAGKKVLRYCKKVEAIIKRKVKDIKERFGELNSV